MCSSSAIARIFALLSTEKKYLDESVGPDDSVRQFSPHSMMGPMSRTERIRRCYLHTDHHLRQFGS
jgi:hypothetical protein